MTNKDQLPGFEPTKQETFGGVIGGIFADTFLGILIDVLKNVLQRIANDGEPPSEAGSQLPSEYASPSPRQGGDDFTTNFPKDTHR